MPSEVSAVPATAREVLKALSGPRDRFRESLILSIEEVRGFLSTHRDPSEDRTSRVAHELGSFASGRIDLDRFASLLQEDAELSPEIRHVMEFAEETLDRLHGLGDELLFVRVAPGGDLRDSVALALERVGRAFAAARLVDRVRRGGTVDTAEARKGLSYRQWSVEERELSPPLVVEVEGSDLVPEGLAEFLDGSLKLVILVRGPGPAAPLAAMIQPGIWVEQAADPQELSGFAEAPVPGICAVVGEGAALFRHVPGSAARASRLKGSEGLPASPGHGGRLEVSHLPADAPRARMGAWTVARQIRALKWLEHVRDWKADGRPAPGAPGALSTNGATTTIPRIEYTPPPGTRSDGPVPVFPGVPAPPQADPAGALAGWLLQNTDLSGL